jgi:hypothetical protein
VLANTSVSAFQRTKRPYANHSVRGDTSQGSDVRSLEQDHQMSEYQNGDRDLDSSFEFDTSAEMQKGDFRRADETSTSNPWPTRHEGSPRSSRRESSPGGPDSMFDSGHQISSGDIQGSPKHIPLSQNVEDSSRSASPESSPVVIAAIQGSQLSIIDESGPPLLHPPDLSIDIQTLRDEVAEEETRTEVETGDELHRPSNITASKSITPIDR